MSNPPQQKKQLEDEWPESIFPQVLIQPRRHLFTSLRRACLRAAMLNVYGHMRAPFHHPTRGNMALAQLSSVQDGSAQLGSVKVGSTQATFREWLCATGSVQVGSARVCSAQCALHELRRAISQESGLRKLHCSRLLRASCSLQAAARK